VKVLVVLSRVPYPLEKGDKLRAYHTIRQLARFHEVYLFALSDEEVHATALPELAKYCKQVEVVQLSKMEVGFNLIRSLFSALPFQVGYFYNKKAADSFRRFANAVAPDHIFCQLIRTAAYRNLCPSIPATLDYMDTFSIGIKRRQEKEPAMLQPIFTMEYNRLLAYEEEAFNHFQHHTVISEQDKSHLPLTPDNKKKVFVLRNGVDFDHFQPSGSVKQYDIIFAGNMNYPPNVESAEYLVRQILPLVKKQLPEANVLLAGANPAPRVKALAGKDVVVSGWIDDMRTAFGSARILVAPMLISIGLQNKLLEAMAMQLPCVTSHLANNALGAITGEQVLVANEPQQYADHIVKLLQNETFAQEIATEGYTFVRENFGWQAVGDSLNNIIEKGNINGY
jgi:sugar transferase (PEP-CTERM/EpsH1 system associated)